MKEIILIKNGELVLKGLNRNTFEDTLVKNIRRHLSSIGSFKVKKAQSTIFIEPAEESFDMEKAIERVGKIFGIAGYSRACVCEKDINDILEKSHVYLAEQLKSVKTFKVEAKRSDKKFPLTSPEICAQVGGHLLQKFDNLSVDVHNPDIVVTVEVRDFNAYIRAGQLQGAGGLPTGTAGKAAILISGGIDSPVAAYSMAKRGLQLDAIHFASPPYTSPRAELKVKQLLSKVACYSGAIKLAVVPFTEIQQLISEKCPEEFFTLIMRRMMMRISEEIATRNNCLALITGESLGQVASQTLPALAVTDSVVNMPALRPLIGMDKEEIIAISRKIDTFEISIQPYEDCCTVFTPRHPKTRPTTAQCEEAEKSLNIEELVNRAVEGTQFSFIE
ncbi:MAG: tRNA 4-thiouridine(8) synthase ThiI [Clostridiales bacterium]|nr:tRNA 4-thiouridine(8) synthase ThiI [Candidatus Equinaster intestinalis]